MAVGFSQTTIAMAHYYVVAVPYTGSSEWFGMRPSSYSYSVPKGWVLGSEVRMSLLLEEHETGQEVKHKLAQSISELKAWVGNLRTDIEAFNPELPNFVRIHVEKRRKDLERRRDIRKQLQGNRNRREVLKRRAFAFHVTDEAMA